MLGSSCVASSYWPATRDAKPHTGCAIGSLSTAATLATPATPAVCWSTASYRLVTRSAARYSDSGTVTRAATTCPGSKPGSTRARPLKLRSSSADADTSTTASATSAHTSADATRACDAPRVPPRPKPPAPAADGDVARQAGTRPNTTPVASDTIAVYASTDPSKPMSRTRGTSPGSDATSQRSAPQ